MYNPIDELAHDIRIYLESYGIKPVYFATIVGWLVLFSYHKEIKNWDKLHIWKKRHIKATIFSVIVVSAFCLLQLTGVIDI